jgi:hypothetical protein
MTIKIISTRGPAEANLQAVEREEQIRAVATVIAAAWGKNTPLDVEQCASKLRSLRSTATGHAMKNLANDFSCRLSKLQSNPWHMNSLDLDIERVKKLLEG